MIEIEGMQDIGSQFLLSFKFSSTLIARRKARSACDAIPAPTTLALIALPMDSAGFRSSGSTRNSDEGQLSRDTRESPLGKLEKIHTSLSFFFSLSLSAHLSHLHSPYPVSAPRGLSRSGTSSKRRIDTEIFSVEGRGGGRCTGRITVPRTGTPR